MIKLSDYVMKFLADSNVGHVFMLSGGGCMHLVDSLGRENRLEFICCLHEQAAAVAAAAYAQYTNNLGVALVTTGPGGTNAITGVAAAWTDSIPLLIISGQVKSADISRNGLRTLGFQEICITDIVKPITKYAVTITEPTDIRQCLEEAVYFAKSGRPGPVWIDIPLDVQAAMINEKNLSGYIATESKTKDTFKLHEQIEKTIELINKSQRPAIIAGYGIKLSNAEENFKKVVEVLGMPVLTTWKAIDLLSDDDVSYFGRPGCIGQRGANFIQQNADLIISIGARLDFGQIGYSHDSFAVAAKKVIIDIDKSELEKFSFNTDISICCDAGEFIDTLLSKQDLIAHNERTAWLTKCLKWKRKYPVVTEEHFSEENGASAYALVELLSRHSKHDDVFAPGNSGACSEVFMQAYKVKKSQRVIGMNGLGSMGTGLPSAIGACIASGKRQTICVNGDGGFQMNIQELETIASLNLPIKIFILNNNGYGSIMNMQRNYFEGFFVGSTPESGVTLPNIVKVAKAYGIDAIRVSSNAELESKLVEILSDNKPFICDIIISPKEQTAPRVTSVVTEDGRMVSKPLEDLWPFLDRDEFENEMLIYDK
jgi:acetolactate synthase-1/2/3 large subunit